MIDRHEIWHSEAIWPSPPWHSVRVEVHTGCLWGSRWHFMLLMHLTRELIYRPASWIYKISKFWRSAWSRWQYASPYQVWQWSVKPFLEYSDLAIFQNGGGRHVVFLNFWNFNNQSRGSNCVSVQNVMQIGQTDDKLWRFFNLSRWWPPHLDVRNFKIVMAEKFKRAKLCHCPKSHADRSNGCGGMSISRWRPPPSWIFKFWKF